MWTKGNTKVNQPPQPPYARFVDRLYDPAKIVAVLIGSEWIYVNEGTFQEVKINGKEFFIAESYGMGDVTHKIVGDSEEIQAMKLTR